MTELRECSRCHEAEAVPGQRWCKACRAANKREARRREKSGKHAGNGARIVPQESDPGILPEDDPAPDPVVELQREIRATLIAARRSLATDQLAVALGRPVAELRPILLDMARQGLIRRREMPWAP